MSFFFLFAEDLVDEPSYDFTRQDIVIGLIVSVALLALIAFWSSRSNHDKK